MHIDVGRKNDGGLHYSADEEEEEEEEKRKKKQNI